MTSPRSLAAKDHALIVEFKYGSVQSPLYYRATSYSRAIALPASSLIFDAARPFSDDGVFRSIPQLDAELPEEVGTLEKNSGRIKAPRDDFFDRLSSGEPHSRVVVRVGEVNFDGATIEAKWLTQGRALLGTRNPNGVESLVEVEFASERGVGLETKIGICCTEECAWIFGGKGCGIDVESIVETGTLTAADGFNVTITGISAQAATHWRRGSVRLDGLDLMIRDYDPTDPDVWNLYRQPPADWLGADVDVVPGCDGQLSTCRTEWDNESESGFFGWGMLSYDPRLDTP